MTREALRAGAISFESVSEALMHSRGDIFIASQLLGCTAREVDGYVRASDELRAFVQAIAQVKNTDDYDKLSGEQYERELQRVVARDRLEGQTIIADLARDLKAESAAMAEVKLKAAIAMRGETQRAGTNDTGQASALAELNRAYIEAAPRIRSVRIAAQIEYELPSPGA